MTSENLWAPWRIEYILAAKDQLEGCFICRGRDSRADRENLIVARTAHGVVLLNRYPYNNGHLLVAPAAHKQGLDELSDEEVLDLMRSLRDMLRRLDAVLRPDGYNIGLNLGRVAGAGLPGHLHWHVVPRWNGDTNFMPVASGTRVMSQSLSSLYDLLTTGSGAAPEPPYRARGTAPEPGSQGV